jgi:hypothetical protein
MKLKILQWALRVVYRVFLAGYTVKMWKWGDGGGNILIFPCPHKQRDLTIHNAKWILNE